MEELEQITLWILNCIASIIERRTSFTLSAVAEENNLLGPSDPGKIAVCIFNSMAAVFQIVLYIPIATR